MSNAEYDGTIAATSSASPAGMPRSRKDARRSSKPARSRPDSSLGMAARTVPTPGASELTVSAMPNGGRLFISSQRAVRSMSLRASRTTVIRASTSTVPASASTCCQKARMP